MPTGLVQSEDHNTKTSVGRAKVTESDRDTPSHGNHCDMNVSLKV